MREKSNLNYGRSKDEGKCVGNGWAEVPDLPAGNERPNACCARRINQTPTGNRARRRSRSVLRTQFLPGRTRGKRGAMVGMIGRAFCDQTKNLGRQAVAMEWNSGLRFVAEHQPEGGAIEGDADHMGMLQCHANRQERRHHLGRPHQNRHHAQHHRQVQTLPEKLENPQGNHC